MAQVIYKFGPFEGQNTLKCYGKPVKINGQHGEMYCWCLVDVDNPGPDLYVQYVATGERFNGKYIDTFFDEHGFVWHLVETPYV